MITALILAAGEGSRMGTLKQLLPWQESTILETVLGNIASCRYVDDEIRVVLGAKAEKIRPVLHKHQDEIDNLKIFENRDYKKGMLSSVRKGLMDLSENTEYIMLSLVDQPLITKEIYDQVLTELFQKRPEIMVPVTDGKRGHPLIFSVDYLDEVFKLPGPGGLRRLLDNNPEDIYHFPIDDERILIDLDYIEEYKEYRQ